MPCTESKALRVYLNRYAFCEPELESVGRLGPFAQIVFVPLCGEDSLVDDLVSSVHTAAQTQTGSHLLLFIVNGSSRTREEHREANRSFLKRYPALSQWSPNLVVAVLDRTDRWLEGVGEARKIGGDFALQLFDRGLLQSDWIHTTDADARVGEDYFDCRPMRNTPFGLGPLERGAVVHPFRHLSQGPLGTAIDLYDRFLRYYATGLSYAGSPFAYPTIGSTLSFGALAYAQVRGFPKRAAGEDFYFLHKIAKVGFVWQGGGPVTLIARPSDRVPFGTGQSIEKIDRLLKEGETYRVYNPVIFDCLKEWLSAIEQLSQQATWDDIQSTIRPDLVHCLTEMGAPAVTRQIAAQHKTYEARLRHWHTWFDGFRTLRLVHLLRDAYPNVPLPQHYPELTTP